jgi:hypothetical protein
MIHGRTSQENRAKLSFEVTELLLENWVLYRWFHLLKTLFCLLTNPNKQS